MGKLVEVCCLQGHEDRVWNVSWTPDGSTLASCGGDKKVALWQQSRENEDGTQTWASVGEIPTDAEHTRTVRSVAWTPNNTYVACGSFDSTISVWQKVSGEYRLLSTLEGHENEVKSVAWDSSSSFLATCSRDKSVWIWECLGGEFECAAVLHGHAQDVKMVQWVPNQRILMSASYDDTIKMWVEEEEDEWVCVQTLSQHSSTVWSIAFDPSGEYMVSGGDDNAVIVWKFFSKNDSNPVDVGSWKNVCTLTGHHTRTIFSVDWSIDGKLASGGGDNKLCIYKQSTDRKSVV